MSEESLKEEDFTVKKVIRFKRKAVSELQA